MTSAQARSIVPITSDEPLLEPGVHDGLARGDEQPHTDPREIKRSEVEAPSRRPYSWLVVAMVAGSLVAAVAVAACLMRDARVEPQSEANRVLEQPAATAGVAEAGAASVDAHMRSEGATAKVAVAGVAPADASSNTSSTKKPTAAPTPAPTPAPTRPPCAEAGGECTEAHCCNSSGEQCYQKSSTFAQCKPECIPGPDMSEPEYAIWSCKKLGKRAAGKPRVAHQAVRKAPSWARAHCSAYMNSCNETMCCRDEGMQCYAKNKEHAACKPSCSKGPDLADTDGRHWSCKEIGPRTPGKAAEIDENDLPVPDWIKKSCSVSGENCNATLCCSEPGLTCFAKNKEWSSCKPDCVPGPQPEDRADEDWLCNATGPRTPGEPGVVRIRRGSFLALGDWGWDEEDHWKNVPTQACQKAIAEAMDAKMSELGDVKFIVNVGDSFYPDGVSGKDDPQWDKKWRWVYSIQLRSVPWYSVYGNHDYHHDPCACDYNEDRCAQVNHNESDFEHFAMPGMSYFKDRPDLGIEIVGLDLNNYHDGYDQGYNGNPTGLRFPECQHTPCFDYCQEIIQNRTAEGFKLFYERVEKSKAKSMVVFSHYPTDYFSSAPEFLEKLRDNSKHGIVYFGGHRHSTDRDSTISIQPNQNWLVGGGGGYSCDTMSQGFVVAEIWGDSTITTYPVLVPPEVCCK